MCKVVLGVLLGAVLALAVAFSVDPVKLACPVPPEYRWPAAYWAAGAVYLTAAVLTIRAYGPVDDYRDPVKTTFLRGAVFLLSPLIVVVAVPVALLYLTTHYLLLPSHERSLK